MKIKEFFGAAIFTILTYAIMIFCIITLVVLTPFICLLSWLFMGKKGAATVTRIAKEHGNDSNNWMGVTTLSGEMTSVHKDDPDYQEFAEHYGYKEAKK